MTLRQVVTQFFTDVRRKNSLKQATKKQHIQINNNKTNPVLSELLPPQRYSVGITYFANQ